MSKIIYFTTIGRRIWRDRCRHLSLHLEEAVDALLAEWSAPEIGAAFDAVCSLVLAGLRAVG
ncbi:hypothetical protein [Planomonospora sp. ID82291]|uniref:hypothetical protein n=1 Tax=Planomonospora sp. ID82291 TaxID=2738136 RepID=UPI0018C36AAB|nr:hypothetical protein [Planomonospora sp. ID82291]MBG0816960.1 hypothetical protein [Planomonospora sp. ID82291]